MVCVCSVCVCVHAYRWAFYIVGISSVFPSPVLDDYEVKLEPNSSGGILGKLRGMCVSSLPNTSHFTEKPGKVNME